MDPTVAQPRCGAFAGARRRRRCRCPRCRELWLAVGVQCWSWQYPSADSGQSQRGIFFILSGSIHFFVCQTACDRLATSRFPFGRLGAGRDLRVASVGPERRGAPPAPHLAAQRPGGSRVGSRPPLSESTKFVPRTPPPATRISQRGRRHPRRFGSRAAGSSPSLLAARNQGPARPKSGPGAHTGAHKASRAQSGRGFRVYGGWDRAPPEPDALRVSGRRLATRRRGE